METAEACGVGDHGGVIGADGERGGRETGAVLGGGLFQCSPDGLVGGDTPCGNEGKSAGLLQGAGAFAGQDGGNGGLEGRRNVGPLLGVGWWLVVEKVANRRFEAGEGEVQRFVVLRHG